MVARAARQRKADLARPLRDWLPQSLMIVVDSDDDESGERCVGGVPVVDGLRRPTQGSCPEPQSHR